MIGIIRVGSASSSTPSGSWAFALGIKPAIATRFVHGTAVYASRERTADLFELSSGSSASVAEYAFGIAGRVSQGD